MHVGDRGRGKDYTLDLMVLWLVEHLAGILKSVGSDPPDTPYGLWF